MTATRFQSNARRDRAAVAPFRHWVLREGLREAPILVRAYSSQLWKSEFHTWKCRFALGKAYFACGSVSFTHGKGHFVVGNVHFQCGKVRFAYGLDEQHLKGTPQVGEVTLVLLERGDQLLGAREKVRKLLEKVIEDLARLKGGSDAVSD